jgi:DNA-binding transcriptional regulator YbjK
VADRFAIVRAGESELAELEQAATTKAEKARWAKIRGAMRALDEEQMIVKEAIANLIDTLETGYSRHEVIEDLKTMIDQWDRESRALAQAVAKEKERQEKAKENA